MQYRILHCNHMLQKKSKSTHRTSDSSSSSSNSSTSSSSSSDSGSDSDSDSDSGSDAGVLRSIITGKKIKMSREQTLDDQLLELERAAKRHCMNSQY